MGELDQFDEIIKGFKNIVKTIESLDYQEKEDDIKEELELLKKSSELQIKLISYFKKSAGEIGIEEIETLFGKDKIKQDLKNCSMVLKFMEGQLLMVKALIEGNLKTIH